MEKAVYLLIIMLSAFHLANAKLNLCVYKKNGDMTSFVASNVDSISFTPPSDDSIKWTLRSDDSVIKDSTMKK